MKHILSARQFSRDEILEIFAQADEMALVYQNGGSQDLSGCKQVINLFCQPSTRTFSSFEIALKALGGKMLLSLPSYEASSFSKGESVPDTIRYYCETYQPHVGAIILRHPQEGAAEVAAQIADDYGVCIINAGDGRHEHPTQALLDLYTIWKERKGEIDGVKVAFCNALDESRTINSAGLMLALNFRLPIVYTCAPCGIRLSDELASELQKKGIPVFPSNDLAEVTRFADFVYMTRPQKEYYENQERRKIFEGFQITRELLDSLPPDNPCRVMHPMPVDSETFNEITPEAKRHPRCIMIRQAANGLPIRMALLKKLLCPN